MDKKIVVSLVVMSLVMTLSIGLVNAGNSKVGTTGATFLKILPASRPSALGGTYGAIGNDIDSILSNPAGISQLKGKEVVANQTSWFEGVTLQYIALGIPIKDIGTIGIGINSLSVDGIERRETVSDVEPINNFGATDMAITIAYASTVGEKTSLGLNLKSISSKIDDKSASTIGIDVGVIYKTTEKVSIGAAVQNIGSGLKFIDETSALPMNIKIGVGYKADENMVIGADINSPNDNNVSISLGGEYAVKVGDEMSLPIRLGYKTGVDTGGVSAGIGINYKSMGVDITLAPYGDLGNTLRAGIKFKF